MRKCKVCFRIEPPAPESPWSNGWHPDEDLCNTCWKPNIGPLLTQEQMELWNAEVDVAFAEIEQRIDNAYLDKILATCGVCGIKTPDGEGICPSCLAAARPHRQSQ